MEQRRIDALAERIELLERRLRRWRSLGLAAVAALGLALIFVGPEGRYAGAEEKEVKEYNINVPPEVFQIGQPKHVEELRARRIVLVDKRGEARGTMQVTETGTPSLELFGRSGRTQAALSVKGSGRPSLVLYDKVGRVIWRAP